MTEQISAEELATSLDAYLDAVTLGPLRVRVATQDGGAAVLICADQLAALERALVRPGGED